ncbi:unnamed protein product [Trichogramma brassicae]|uniref:RING-type domain-containing protein n=1 Tax=Trichogramma brassicae TaxID=86971 RepID=A0A6H5J0S1_9HYME|nr:unnamed protein product [Trichogramma brassicae]
MRTPEYLLRIVASYLSARELDYDTDDGPECYRVPAGVPQRSDLGPILWNVMYDAVLRLNLRGNVKIVGFADDIALVAVAKNLWQIEYNLSSAIEQVRCALQERHHAFQLSLGSRIRRPLSFALLYVYRLYFLIVYYMLVAIWTMEFLALIKTFNQSISQTQALSYDRMAEEMTTSTRSQNTSLKIQAINVNFIYSHLLALPQSSVRLFRDRSRLSRQRGCTGSGTASFIKLHPKRRSVGPRNFSVYGVHTRTNNAIESYHSILSYRLGADPPFWQWLGNIKRMVQWQWIDFATMESGRTAVRHPSNATRFRGQRLQQDVVSSTVNPNVSRIQNRPPLPRPLDRAIAGPSTAVDGPSVARVNNSRLKGGSERELVAAGPSGISVHSESDSDEDDVPAMGTRSGSSHREGPIISRPLIQENAPTASEPMTIANDQSRPSNDFNDAETCSVCMYRPKTHSFVPCGHWTCCEWCAIKIMMDGKICPNCRAEALCTVRISLSMATPSNDSMNRDEVSRPVQVIAPTASEPMSDANDHSMVGLSNGSIIAGTCSVCKCRPKTNCFVPCGHWPCCEWCAIRIMMDEKECPVCRAEAVCTTKIFQ